MLGAAPPFRAKYSSVFESISRYSDRTDAVRVEIFNFVTKLLSSARDRVFSGACEFVCGGLSAFPGSKRKTARAINTKLGTHLLYRRISACIDSEVKRSKVKVTPL